MKIYLDDLAILLLEKRITYREDSLSYKHTVSESDADRIFYLQLRIGNSIDLSGHITFLVRNEIHVKECCVLVLDYDMADGLTTIDAIMVAYTKWLDRL